MNRFTVFLTVGCAACTADDLSAEDDSKQVTSSGSFSVEAEGLGISSTLTTWQADLQATHELSAAKSGEEQVLYWARFGAASPDNQSVIGVHLLGSDWSDFAPGSTFSLSPADELGEESNQVNVRIGETYLISDGGSVSISTLSDGQLQGTLTTTLLDLSDPDASYATTATFDGIIQASCMLYSFPEEGEEGSWLTTGVEDSGCAALFE